MLEIIADKSKPMYFDRPRKRAALKKYSSHTPAKQEIMNAVNKVKLSHKGITASNKNSLYLVDFLFLAKIKKTPKLKAIIGGIAIRPFIIKSKLTEK